MKKRTLFLFSLLLGTTHFALAASPVTLRLADVKGDRLVALQASGELTNLPYHLTVNTFDSGAPVQEALNAGAVDVGFTGDLPFLYVFAAGAPVKVISAWRNNPDSIALIQNENGHIDNLTALRGKKIAVNRGGWGHYLLLGLLQKAGLTTKDVDIRFLPPTDGRAALVTGAVDAWIPWEPYLSSALILDHAKRVAQGGGRGIMSGYSFMVARQDAIQSDKRAAIGDLVTRLAKSQVWALQHPQAFSQALSKALHVPSTVTLAWVNSAKVTPAVLNHQVVNELQKEADFFTVQKILPKAVNVSNAFDFSLSQQANEIAHSLTPSSSVKTP